MAFWRPDPANEMKACRVLKIVEIIDSTDSRIVLKASRRISRMLAPSLATAEIVS